ncbi:RNA-directed DNA polymerase from mobile element jockey [Trichonephila clavipes]|nr:RNA-directed DNA polymerase from mobile element jockey [Trichonephila clavipes]
MWHDGLIYKMIRSKFPTYLIKIIHSYLDNRTFNVKLNNVLSCQRPILASTPQGSILSPAFYNIYTCDFPRMKTQQSAFSPMLLQSYATVARWTKPSTLPKIISSNYKYGQPNGG